MSAVTDPAKMNGFADQFPGTDDPFAGLPPSSLLFEARNDDTETPMDQASPNPPNPDRSPTDTLLDDLLAKLPVRTGSPGWGKLEIMGHRAFVGFVSERELFGDRQAVIEVIDKDGTLREAGIYSKASFFAFTPMSQRDVARRTSWVQDAINDLAYTARRALPPAPASIEPDGLDEDEAREPSQITIAPGASGTDDDDDLF